MIALAAAWAWLLTAAPLCADAGASADRLRAADAPELLLLSTEASRQLGAPLLHRFEDGLGLEARRTLAASRLGTACALQALPSKAAVPGDALALKALLDGPEFSRARDRNPQALEQLLARLRDWLEGLLGNRPAEAFASGVRLLVLVVAALILAWAVWRLSRVRAARSERHGAAASGPAALELLDPTVHLEQAQRLVASDPRSAMREALLGLLSLLERRAWARPDRVKTNRELAAELPERGAPPELTAQVGALLQGYDRAWYSLAQIPSELARDFVTRVQALRPELEVRR